MIFIALYVSPIYLFGLPTRLIYLARGEVLCDELILRCSIPVTEGETIRIVLLPSRIKRWGLYHIALHDHIADIVVVAQPPFIIFHTCYARSLHILVHARGIHIESYFVIGIEL